MHAPAVGLSSACDTHLGIITNCQLAPMAFGGDGELLVSPFAMAILDDSGSAPIPTISIHSDCTHAYIYIIIRADALSLMDGLE